jgi:hypothetical protein
VRQKKNNDNPTYIWPARVLFFFFFFSFVCRGIQYPVVCSLLFGGLNHALRAALSAEDAIDIVAFAACPIPVTSPSIADVRTWVSHTPSVRRVCSLLCTSIHIGRFLIRPSDSLFLAPQSDLEKNQNVVRKALARSAQSQGVFGSPP